MTNTAQGEKMNDSIGKECTPSTNLVKNRDDFASFNAFGSAIAILLLAMMVKRQLRQFKDRKISRVQEK